MNRLASISLIGAMFLSSGSVLADSLKSKLEVEAEFAKRKAAAEQLEKDRDAKNLEIELVLQAEEAMKAIGITEKLLGPFEVMQTSIVHGKFEKVIEIANGDEVCHISSYIFHTFDGVTIECYDRNNTRTRVKRP